MYRVPEKVPRYKKTGRPRVRITLDVVHGNITPLLRSPRRKDDFMAAMKG